LNKKTKAFNGVNFAQDAKFAKKRYIFSADPRGIGFAFHRAGKAEKNMLTQKP
jgi:hypothetical protein